MNSTNRIGDSNDTVLRLDGGTTINGKKSPSPSLSSGKNSATTPKTNGTSNGTKKASPPPPPKRSQPSKSNEADKFTAICENTTNENYENLKIDTTRNQTNSFLNGEVQQQNGNTPTLVRSNIKPADYYEEPMFRKN